jgi:DNA-binding MarR family transcriptional regulator
VDDAERLTDALLDVSRALVAVAARSLADIDDQMTLPEVRALVVLHRVGPLPVTLLAERVGVHQSTATRIAARLRRRDLVGTDKDREDRRLTVVRLTPAGRSLVDGVVERRRAEIAAVVRRLPDADIRGAHAALAAFADALQGGAPSDPSPTHASAATGTWAL